MKHKINIHWNAFWAIGGSLIGAIIVTIAVAMFGYVKPFPYNLPQNSAIKLLPAVIEETVLALSWIVVGLTIIPSFFNKKPVRSSIYAAAFIFQLFTVLLVVFKLAFEMINVNGDGKPEMSLNSNTELEIVLILVAFIIPDIIGESVWLGLENRKVRKLKIVESNVTTYGKFKFVWGGIYAVAATLIIAVLATVTAYIFGTLSNHWAIGGKIVKASPFDLAIEWTFYSTITTSASLIMTILPWVAFAASLFLMFFDQKAVKISIFTVGLLFIIIASLAIALNGYGEFTKFMDIQNKYANYDGQGEQQISPVEMYQYIYSLFETMVNAIMFIITIVSGPTIMSRYMKSFKTKKVKSSKTK